MDGVVWNNTTAKEQAVIELRDVLRSPKKYNAKNIRREYIPKRNSAKMRPIGIPVVGDRAVQRELLSRF